MDPYSKSPGFEAGERFYVTPILLGGDPLDEKNVVFLDRKQHIEAVRFWNRIIRQKKEQIPNDESVR